MFTDLAQKSTKKAKGSWPKISKKLYTYSNHDLISLIEELHNMSKINQDFLENRFLDNDKVLERYKKKIKQYIAPEIPAKTITRSWSGHPIDPKVVYGLFDSDMKKIHIKKAKQMLTDYKKSTNGTMNILELMTYYIECGIEFSEKYKHLDRDYDDSLIFVFDHAIKLMKNFEDFEITFFLDRIKVTLTKSQHCSYSYYYHARNILKHEYPHIFNEDSDVK